MQNKNEKLFELSKIFNRIESYDDNDNIGFRSLKNNAIFLILYLLADDKTQILKELAQKANIHSQEGKQALAALVNNLAHVSMIKECIDDYKKANGTFTVDMGAENAKIIKNKLNLFDITGELASYVRATNIVDNTFILTMENQIKFRWLDDACYKVTNQFKNQTMDYLAAKQSHHKFKYQLLNHEGKYYNVVAFNVTESKPQNANIYFMMPVNGSNLVTLRDQYYPIIETSDKKNESDFTLSDYNQLKKQKDILGLDSIVMKEYEHETEITFLESLKNSGPDYYFTFSFNFPALQDKLKTTETRLGVYSVFNMQSIAGIAAVLTYNGLRQLHYDKNGGEILNRERVTVKPASNGPRLVEPKYFQKNIYVHIEVTFQDAFMFIYQSPEHKDYYPFVINNPKEHLKKTFQGKSQSCTLPEDLTFAEGLKRYSIFTDTTNDSEHNTPDCQGCRIV